MTVTDRAMRTYVEQGFLEEALRVSGTHAADSCEAWACSFDERPRRAPRGTQPHEILAGQVRAIQTAGEIIRDRAARIVPGVGISCGDLEIAAEFAQAGTPSSRAAHLPPQTGLVPISLLGLRLSSPGSSFRARNLTLVPVNRVYPGGEPHERAHRVRFTRSVNWGFSDIALVVDGVWRRSEPSGPASRRPPTRASIPLAVQPIMPPYGPLATTFEIDKASTSEAMESAVVDAIRRLYLLLACSCSSLEANDHPEAARELRALPLAASAFEFGASRRFGDRGTHTDLEWLWDPVRSNLFMDFLGSQHAPRRVLLDLDMIGVNTAAYDTSQEDGPRLAGDGRPTVHTNGVFARERPIEAVTEAWRDITQHVAGTPAFNAAAAFLGYREIPAHPALHVATSSTPITLQTSDGMRPMTTLMVASRTVSGRARVFATHSAESIDPSVLPLTAISRSTGAAARAACHDRWRRDAMIGAEMTGRGAFDDAWNAIALAGNFVYLDTLFG